MAQAEIDILGVYFQKDISNIYAIDVAFHEAGLNYGSRNETVSRVTKKIIRTAMCINGYLGSKNAKIIFASPKINPAIYEDLVKSVHTVNEILTHSNINYEVRIIANQDFNDEIILPVLRMLGDVADTSELFMRSLQLYYMFADRNLNKKKSTIRQASQKITQESHGAIQAQGIAGFEGMKIGVIANKILRDILESGKVPISDIEKFKHAEHSKSVFHIQYPLLRQTGGPHSKRSDKYYAKPLKIHGGYYFMCCEWYEQPTNNDRPYLIEWLSGYIG